MAAETVIIDVIANFKDKMSPGIDNAKRKADILDKSMANTKKQIDALNKDKATVKLDAQDRATSKIGKVLDKAKEFGGKIYKGTLQVDDNTPGNFRRLMNSVGSFAGKTFSSTLSIVDKVTAPIKGIMNTIFSLKTLVAGVAGGVAFNQLISSPIGQADQLETAKIGFETMFNSSTKADNMIGQIQDFAAKTPFETSGVISSVQQMMRAGWTEDTVISDMEKIGNAAAAAGQGTEGVQGIVTALQQMRMAGKLNSQDMMQLTNRGVKAWEYVAEAMGTTIPEARKLASDGLIPVDKAIQGIIDGMGEYDGMMEKMSNRTVSGIMANLQDTFDIKLVSKWGKGLAEGATRGLGKLADYLDEIDPMLQKAGTSLEDLGSQLSTGFFDIVEKGYTKLGDIISSEEFQNADGIVPKFKILWDKAIAEPFGKWWDSKGYPWMIDKMTSAGRNMGSGLSNIIKGLLGFNAGDVVDDATSIGSGFAKGFLDGFDGSGVWDALRESIKNGFKDAFSIVTGNGDGSSWLSAALLGYGGMKLAGGFNTVSGMLGGPTTGTLLKSLIGSTGNTIMQGSGLLNLLANAGYGLTGGAASAGGYFGAGTAMGGGMAALAGLGGIAGGVAGGASLFSGAKDIYRSAKADISTDLGEKEANAYGISGMKKVGGVAAGAAIGSIFGPLGALIGAGVGGVAGWMSGKKNIEEYEKAVKDAKIAQDQAKYSSKEMKDAVKDLADGTITATEFQEKFNAAVSEDKSAHFGNIKLSISEIADIAEKITFDTAKEGLNKFASAASEAESSLSNLQTASNTMEKWVWKGSLGFKLSETDISSYKEAVDNYISSAKSYIENKHYEFTAAVNVLLDTKSAEGITSTADGMYAKIQEELSTAGKELTTQVDIALKDGKITADEQSIITKAQQEVQKIVDKIAKAETEAEFKTLKIKYGGGDLDAESFANLQSELATSVENAMASYDEALQVSIAGLQLEYEEGAITEDQLNEQIAKLTEGYNAKVDELAVRVEGFQFEALTDSYGEELEKALADSDFSGTTAEKISQAMQKAMSEGVDVTTWDKETAAKYLGLDSLEDESAQAITDITANIAKTIPEKLSGEDIEMDLSGFVSNIQSSTTKAAESADFSEAGTIIKTKVSEGLSGGEEGEANIDTSGLVTSVQNSVTTSMAEADFSGAGTGVTDGVANAITSAPFDTIQGAIDGLKSKVQSAIDTAFSTGFSTTTTVKITADYKLANPTATLTFSGGGTGTATVSSSITSNATGGFVSGRQLSWVGEEGPEAIIPLVPGRRERGLELWQKAGEALGVLKNAKGGIVGGNGGLLSRLSNSGIDETETTKAADTGSAQPGPIEVNVGGVNIEIKADGNSGDIIQQIKSRSAEVVNVIADMIADAVGEAYENIPLAGID